MIIYLFHGIRPRRGGDAKMITNANRCILKRGLRHYILGFILGVGVNNIQMPCVPRRHIVSWLIWARGETLI